MIHIVRAQTTKQQKGGVMAAPGTYIKSVADIRNLNSTRVEKYSKLYS